MNTTTTNPAALPEDDQLVKLTDVRLRYNDLWVAREFKPGDGKPRWGATFLVEPGSDNDKALLAMITRQATVTWNTKAAAMVRSMAGQSAKNCYLDGSIKPDDTLAGFWVLAAHRSAKAKNGAAFDPPQVLDRRLNPVGARDGLIYNGCYVNAYVRIYCQGGTENPGIRCSLEKVQFVRRGDAFANKASTPDFDDLGELPAEEDADFM